MAHGGSVHGPLTAARGDAAVHPGCRFLDPAEGKEVSADDRARVGAETVTCDRCQLLARIGMRDEAHGAHALSLERPQRRTDAAAMGKPQEGSRICRTGEA